MQGVHTIVAHGAPQRGQGRDRAAQNAPEENNRQIDRHTHNPSCIHTQLGTQFKPGTLPTGGQSPIGGCVFKQMSPLACLHSPHIHTLSIGDIQYTLPMDLEKISKYFFSTHWG